jgi:hypothetical protein
MIDLVIFGAMGLVACALGFPMYIASMKRKAWDNARTFEVPPVFGEGTGYASD